MDKPLEFILVPKYPLFGDSTVILKKILIASYIPGAHNSQKKCQHYLSELKAELLESFSYDQIYIFTHTTVHDTLNTHSNNVCNVFLVKCFLTICSKDWKEKKNLTSK